jgi:branched-chain amino acid transport system substrate-binding protein
MRPIHAAFLASLAIGLTGCPGQGGGAADSKVIKIGVAGPFTGAAAAFGEMIEKGANLKIAEINAAGGINGKQVEAVFEDDRGNTSEAANVSRKLASDKSICLVVGHFNSTCSNAAKKEYNRKGIVEFTPGSTNVAVCAGSPWTFRNLYRDDYQGTFLAQYAKKMLGANKVAVFFDNDDYGGGLKDAFMAEAKKLSLEVLPPIAYTRERTSDFKPLVGKIKGQGAEAIFIAGLYGEAALIAKAAREDFGITVPLLGGDGCLNDTFIKNGGKAAEGAYVTTPFLFEAAENKALAKSFEDSFKAKYNKNPDTWAALTFDAVGMALEAVKQVGPDRKKIRDWLAAVTTPEKAYEGVTGKTYFDKEGDCFSKGAHVAVVKDGKFVAADKQMKAD